jgi:hypothetical protein
MKHELAQETYRKFTLRKSKQPFVVQHADDTRPKVNQASSKRLPPNEDHYLMLLPPAHCNKIAHKQMCTLGKDFDKD